MICVRFWDASFWSSVISAPAPLTAGNTSCKNARTRRLCSPWSDDLPELLTLLGTTSEDATLSEALAKEDDAVSGKTDGVKEKC